MLTRRVVGDEVDNDPQTQGVSIADKLIDVSERAELRVHVAIVADVIARVRLRRGVERVQPDRVDAQVAKIRQPGPDAGQVPDPIAVRVREATDIDLVDHRVPPPRGARPGGRSHCCMLPLRRALTTLSVLPSLQSAEVVVGMDIARVDQVLLILLPTFAIGALLSLPSGVTPLWRLVMGATMPPGSPLITDRAIESACTLRLPHWDRPVHNSLARPELHQRLHTLPEAGLVLPPAVNLSAPNRRR